MALRGSLTHRKTRRLGLALGIDPPCALGVMEALWHVTGEQCPDGAIGSMSNDDLAMEMFSSVDPDRLVQALLTAGLLDEHPDHRLVVHDWHEHSDDTTDLRLGRATRRYANGEMPRLTKLTHAERDRIWARYGEIPPDGGNGGHAEEPSRESVARKATQSHGVALPEPVPVPEPEPETTTPLPPSPGGEDADPAGDGLVLPTADVRPGEAGFEMALGIAARWVTRRAGITKARVERQVGQALEAEVARGGGTLVAAAELADLNYRVFVQDAALLRFRWGPGKFFSEGHWLQPLAWPYDELAMERERRRRRGF